MSIQSLYINARGNFSVDRGPQGGLIRGRLIGVEPGHPGWSPHPEAGEMLKNCLEINAKLQF